jgi:hypothetical protein
MKGLVTSVRYKPNPRRKKKRHAEGGWGWIGVLT